MNSAGDPPNTPGGGEHLQGLVERVTFHNPDTGFAVLQVQVKGRRQTQTVTGALAAVNPGEWLVAEGAWHNDPKHGRQFRARLLTATPPGSREGIEKYLGSGLIHGVGPVYAKKLVARFGEEVFRIIEEESGRLSEIPGIGEERRRRIREAWAEQRIIREVMVFLHSNGVGTSRAVRIYKRYGDKSVDKLREDPYRLARDIQGIGFKTADQIARNIGIPPDSIVRAGAGIEHVLRTAAEEGHAHLPVEEVIAQAAELLAVDTDRAMEGLQRLEANHNLVVDQCGGEQVVYLAGLHRAECGLALTVRDLVDRPTPWPEIKLDAAVDWCQKKFNTLLSQGQQEGLRAVLRASISVVTGGPGTGKTTLMRSLVAILSAKRVRLALCAPTGRAARHLSESCGLPAFTMHRLLEAGRGGFRRGPDNPLDCDAVVVDEASMVDLPLMYRLARALPRHAALVLVGDVDQLPSVGPGTVLADLIASDVPAIARLREIFRQAADSRIVQVAHEINKGEMPNLTAEGESDFLFLQRETPADITRTLVELVEKRIPAKFGLDPVDDIQILCPMKRGDLGVGALNKLLQTRLNPGGTEPGETRFGWEFRPGDKVIQTENDYDREIYNGDIGRVLNFDRTNGLMRVRFDDRTIDYPFAEADALAPAYAITIHKSQGSEFPAVVLPLATQHFIMLARNLIYTAITRGRRLVVLIGQEKALRMAMRRGGENARRRSALVERLLANPH